MGLAFGRLPYRQLYGRGSHTSEGGNTVAYEGWKNYPTWCINLWAANDEGMYDDFRRIAQNRGDRPDASDVASEYKDYIGAIVDEHDATGFISDLLTHALGEVDWYEIAEHWIADEDYDEEEEDEE